jgi:hypothetical protein
MSRWSYFPMNNLSQRTRTQGTQMMKTLSKVQMAEITGGQAGPVAYCGLAMGLATFGGPVAWFGAALFCIAVTPSTAG